MSRPNILVLMPDQHRADILGCAGDPVVQTPTIDRLAAQGATFTNTHCQGPLCMPARASLLTERYVRDHGVYENWYEVDTSMPTFLHSLRDVGYHTTCIGKMHLWSHAPFTRLGGEPPAHTRERRGQLEAYGFAESIETVGKHASLRIGSEYSDHLEARGLLEPYREWLHGHRYAAYDAGGETAPNWATGSVPLPTEDYADVWVGQRAARWIEEYDRDEPWFLWVGFPGPHDPWDAPAEYVDRYRGAEMPMPRSTERPDTASAGPFKDFLEFCVWVHSSSETFTDERIEDVRRYYYANVTLIDDAIAEILAALERSGQADDTWIVYTSDHGEMMGEHRMLMKMVFYEQATKVPLVIRPPGGMAPVVDDRLVEQVDVPATCRDVAGAGGDGGFEGRSLLGRLGAGGEARTEVWSENFGFAMVRTDRHKLVFHEDSLTPAQLFDLEADPTEDHNLVQEPSAGAVLEELLESRARPFLAGGRNVPGPSILDGEEARALQGRRQP